MEPTNSNVLLTEIKKSEKDHFLLGLNLFSRIIAKEILRDEEQQPVISLTRQELIRKKKKCNIQV